ncbi:hypothetical protein LguiA_015389 [Lonicera macranthoides]
MSRTMITQAGHTWIMAVNSEKPNQAMVTTSMHINKNVGPSTYELDDAEHGSQRQTYMSVNRKELGCVYTSEGQYSFLNFERLPHVPEAITVERTMVFVPHPELSIQTCTMENPVVLREANMDDLYSTSRIFNATSCQVDKRKIISPVEAENVVYDCKDTAKSGDDERIVDGREEEQLSDSGRHKVDAENLQTNTANANVSHEDDLRAKITVKGIATVSSPDRKKTTAYLESDAILSADLLSVEHKQLTKSLSNIKTIQKGTLNPIDNIAVAARIEQQHKKSIAMKHMLTQNNDKKILAKEKKRPSKENRERTTSISVKVSSISATM